MPYASLRTPQQWQKRMVDVVVPDYPFESGDEVVALVSGLGATPVMELYVLYDEVERLLEEKRDSCIPPICGGIILHPWK